MSDFIAYTIFAAFIAAVFAIGYFIGFWWAVAFAVLVPLAFIVMGIRNISVF